MKKKNKEVVIPVNLPSDVIQFYERIAELCNTDFNTVLNVVVALGVYGVLGDEIHEKSKKKS